ncbi:MAG: hypothetical protein K6U14_10520 [Firmicutes bacterium]|nr:hypothetical protein [Alicyclobacillaceae bacterium]MCL6498044.1 hypothetical protein [Bacillota bacterium]
MLTEALARLGSLLLDENDNLTTAIRDLSDIEKNTGKFYAAVWLVEVLENGSAFSRPYEVWGTWQTTGTGKRARSEFVPHVEKAVAAPTFWPVGGDPRKPQGRYAVPAYYFYAKDYQACLEPQDPSALRHYLELRLQRTFGCQDQAGVLAERVSAALWPQLREIEPKDSLILICQLGSDSVYRVLPEEQLGSPGEVDLGPSLAMPGMMLAADLRHLVSRLWWARQEEGAEYGRQDHGVCTFCGAQGEVVSSYSKAWPWFNPTWSAPRPSGWKKTDLVEEIACCPRCYASLTYGGKLFGHLSRDVDPVVIRAIFEGQGSSRGPRIQGAAWLLPWHQTVDSRRFLRGVRRMRHRQQDSPRDIHLQDLLGFDNLIPEELNADAYRLTAVYYTQVNADIHLYALVDDIEPGTVATLVNTLIPLAAETLAEEPLPVGRSFPAWLAKAYGGGYIWQSLEKVLRHRPLSTRRLVHRAASRMQHWVKRLPDHVAFAELSSEVRFLYVFRAFLTLYHRHFGIAEEDSVPMRSLTELQQMIQNPETIWDLQEPADVGFVAGNVVREFSRRFWSDQEKDYLKTRVMTFGSRLDPDTLWRRALIPMMDLAERLDIDLGRPFMLRLGQVLRLMETYRETWSRDPDAFLSGFWSGYCLADRTFSGTPSADRNAAPAISTPEG